MYENYLISPRLLVSLNIIIKINNKHAEDKVNNYSFSYYYKSHLNEKTEVVLTIDLVGTVFFFLSYLPCLTVETYN